MPFNFQYAVNDAETANDYTHNAVSDGDVTRGEYRVQLPDGRTQIVKYTADWKNGYNAVVNGKFGVFVLCVTIDNHNTMYDIHEIDWKSENDKNYIRFSIYSAPTATTFGFFLFARN